VWHASHFFNGKGKYDMKSFSCILPFVAAVISVACAGPAGDRGGSGGGTGETTGAATNGTTGVSSGTAAAGTAAAGTGATSGTTGVSTGTAAASSGAASGAGGATSTGSSMTGSGGAGAAATQAEGNYFPPGAVWYKDVSNAPVSPESGAITQWMENHSPPGGWGTGKMKIDFTLVAVDVPPGTAKLEYQIGDSYYQPDCDKAPIPVPEGGAVEENWQMPTDFSTPFSGYNCSMYNTGGDCHMLFVSRSENRLYELYRSTIDSNNTFTGGCLALWDISKVYDANGRGQQCTSADAAGFPMAALLFTVEEVAAGVINHAIRFAVPNDMIRNKKYVAPATHGTNTTGPATSFPYGARLRLRPDYPVDTLSPAAQVVAKAMQKYGMLQADGGQIALMAQSDVLSDVKWADLGFNSASLTALKATDFEVLQFGPLMDVTFNCQRTPIIE
jgi:serine/threonine-protein kinase